MAKRKRQTKQDNSRLKEPEKWVSGDEPMTDAQRSYVNTLARQAGEEEPDDDLTKAEASEKIDELKDKAGIGD